MDSLKLEAVTAEMMRDEAEAIDSVLLALAVEGRLCAIHVERVRTSEVDFPTTIIFEGSAPIARIYWDLTRRVDEGGKVSLIADLFVAVRKDLQPTFARVSSKPAGGTPGSEALNHGYRKLYRRRRLP